MKKLETEIVPADIYCDAHPGQPIFYYNQKDNKLECMKCIIVPAHSVVTDRKTIDSTCKHLLQLLERKKTKVDQDYNREIQQIITAKETIGAIVNNSRQQTASEFLKLTQELFKELEQFREEDEDPFNEICFVNTRFLGLNLGNSLIKGLQYIKVIDIGLHTSNYTLKLIFKGSRDGFKSDDFHRMCEDKPNTLSVVESEHGSIFGGFTSLAWRQDAGWKPDEKAWIFSLTHKTVHRQY